jgi:hypothetical protein
MAAHLRWWAALTQDEQRQLEALLRNAAAAIASSGEDGQNATRGTSSR